MLLCKVEKERINNIVKEVKKNLNTTNTIHRYTNYNGSYRPTRIIHSNYSSYVTEIYSFEPNYDISNTSHSDKDNIYICSIKEIIRDDKNLLLDIEKSISNTINNNEETVLGIMESTIRKDKYAYDKYTSMLTNSFIADIKESNPIISKILDKELNKLQTSILESLQQNMF